ncbi:MAG: endonuclease Q family protein [Candidatus Nezhaarchaeota archaeon]|nr:endonuclease Q family protein [Candidatus Nezhaarchaeota archaeon]MCX8142233.1 endonuclease Q family protein [Candidatus Nezhaarchaeota archaeon]MDW8050794.1 endonuclease Q family protein [Nitrososphaerota archaeon]
MLIYADLHIHSRYSGATSEKMNIRELAVYAPLKGINLLGTGDALHPSWLKELKENFEDVAGTGLYKVKNLPTNLYFVVQTEVGTVHDVEGKARRIHHVVLLPNLEAAEQAVDALGKLGDLEKDGRPVFTMHPAELVELLLELDKNIFIFPAHAWTPWWSIFGSIGGVDELEDCYGDKSHKIKALETGLSSDPEMNWRVSSLDRLALLSNSDSHSPYPHRLGREANVFNLKELSYSELIRAISEKDPTKFLMTIEVDPAYGKYHWTGHRRCGVSMSPEEAIKRGNICPVCGKQLTKGVEQRVEELADRPRGFRPPNSIGFKRLLPLAEIIAAVLNIRGEAKLYSGRVWELCMRLINKFGSELNVLLNSSFDELRTVVPDKVANVIVRVREGKVTIKPGYDGVYGQLILEGEEERKTLKLRRGQASITDYLGEKPL